MIEFTYGYVESYTQIDLYVLDLKKKKKHKTIERYQKNEKYH